VLRRTLLAVTIAVVVVASAPAALASFPGSNGRIAFTNAKGQIATSLPDGTMRKTLTHLPGGSAEAPMFSASGAWIVFDRYDGGRKGLYVVKADGTHLHRVVHRPGSEWGPSWSPDGQWITYAADGGGSAIMAARRDGTHIHRLGTHTGEYPRYSPDGKRIVYGDTDGSIHIMRSNGTHNHAITGALGDYPDWSPNGKWIGFSSGGTSGSSIPTDRTCIRSRASEASATARSSRPTASGWPTPTGRPYGHRSSTEPASRLARPRWGAAASDGNPGRGLPNGSSASGRNVRQPPPHWRGTDRTKGSEP